MKQLKLVQKHIQDKKISENLVVALDWGITFKVQSPIDNNINYIGIRETDISVTCNEHGENCFKLSITEVKQTPSGTILMAAIDANKNVPSGLSSNMQISKKTKQTVL